MKSFNYLRSESGTSFFCFDLRFVHKLPRTLCAMYVFLACVGMENPLWSQNYLNLDAGEEGLSISCPSLLLNEGDTVLVDLLLGNAGSPIANAAGFEIWLELTDEVQLVPLPKASPGNGWTQVNTSFDPSLGHLLVTAPVAENTIHSQSGKLCSLSLVATQDSVHADSLIEAFGGILIIENIGFKRHLVTVSPVQSQFQVYPNPATDQIHFAFEGPEPKEIRIIGPKGQVIKVTQQSHFRETDLRHLPSGLYRAVAVYDTQQKVQSFVLQR